MSEIEALKARLKAFVKARDWEQFHSPKNLAMALSVEVAELVEKFNIEKVNSSPSQFDPNKLANFQGVYVRKLTNEQVAEHFAEQLSKAGVISKAPSPEDRARLLLLAKAEKERIRAFSEIVDKARIYFVDEVSFDAKALENLTKKPGIDALLAGYRAALDAEAFDDHDRLQAHARSWVEKSGQGFKFKDLVHPVRAALTGTTQGPSLFDVMLLCGKKKTLERLARGEEMARARAPKP